MNVGNYSVVVSNAYGMAISASASLASHLEFLVFKPVAGVLPLFIGNSDNTPITPERAAGVRGQSARGLGPSHSVSPLGAIVWRTPGLGSCVP